MVPTAFTHQYFPPFLRASTSKSPWEYPQWHCINGPHNKRYDDTFMIRGNRLTELKIGCVAGGGGAEKNTHFCCNCCTNKVVLSCEDVVLIL